MKLKEIKNTLKITPWREDRGKNQISIS